jgi:hypothetical protein
MVKTAVSREQRQIKIQSRQDVEVRAAELEQLDRHLQRWRGACVMCMAARGDVRAIRSSSGRSMSIKLSIWAVK